LALWILLSLFVARVLGQGLVAWLGPPFLPPMERWQSGLISYPLLLAMVLRYGMRMWLLPHERWLGGTIPILFHAVLACFLLRLGLFHLRARPAPAGPPGPGRAAGPPQ
jgi:hypothetical protein